MQRTFGFFGSILIGAVSATAIAAETPSTYAALAYSPSTHHFAVATEQVSREAAAQEALRRCGVSDCEIREAVKDSCVALAHDSGWLHLGFADGLTEDSARQLATVNCTSAEAGVSCDEVRSFCSSPHLPPPASGSGPTFVALAISRSQGVVGSSTPQPSAVAAAKSAIASCGIFDCQVVQSTDSGCLSAATGTSQDGYVYFGFGHDAKTRQGAEWLANDICERDAKTPCTIIADACVAGLDR